MYYETNVLKFSKYCLRIFQTHENFKFIPNIFIFKQFFPKIKTKQNSTKQDYWSLELLFFFVFTTCLFHFKVLNEEFYAAVHSFMMSNVVNFHISDVNANFALILDTCNRKIENSF